MEVCASLYNLLTIYCILSCHVTFLSVFILYSLPDTSLGEDRYRFSHCAADTSE